MKKWPIFAVIAVLLVLYGVLVAYWFNTKPQLPEPTQPQESVLVTVPVTQPTEAPTTVPTTVATEPTLPVFEAPDETALTARHAFVYDLTYDQLLYTYGDQTERISPASLTKLFTVYVALQYLEEDTIIEVGEEAGWIARDSSVAAIREGTKLSVGMIVQGTLMQSGNDGAYALAVAAGRAIAGDELLDPQAALAGFMAEVNSQLKLLGFADTSFVTPDGYDKTGHYSTAADLMGIARLALTQPLIVRYASIPEAVVTFESGENYTWKNTNWLLREADHPDLFVPQATGLKTGGTSKAGQCLIATFQDGDRTLMVGVLGCELMQDRFMDAIYLFEHYRLP